MPTKKKSLKKAVPKKVTKKTTRKLTRKLTPGTTAKGGRPKKKTDWKEVDKLLKLGCVGEEVAQYLGCSYDTISRNCLKDHKILYSDYVEEHSAPFRVSLRRLQLRSAQGVRAKEKLDKNGAVANPERGFYIQPSIAMQIFLGKQYLNQKDRPETEGTGIEATDFEYEIIENDKDKS